MAVKPNAGDLVKAACHAAASAYYGSLCTTSNRGTPSGYKWKSTAGQGQLIRASDLEVDTISYTITVNWKVPQKGVIISCTGCATATNSTAYSGTNQFVCNTTGTKYITVALSGGSGQNCGIWQATASQVVSGSGSTTKDLKINYYLVHGANTRGLQKVIPPAYSQYSNYVSVSQVPGVGWQYSNQLALHCGMGSTNPCYASHYSRIYATLTTNCAGILSSNPSTDSLPWVTCDNYAVTWTSGFTNGSKNVVKFPSTNIWLLLSHAVSGGYITVTDWYLA